MPTVDVWASADAYEAYVGRWSRRVARELIAALDVPRERAWLDVGSGTGALSATIVELSAPRSVLGVDSSPGFVAGARGRVTDPRVHFEVRDAGQLGALEGRFDAAVSGLVLNFLPSPRSAVAEMARLTAPDGIVAAYVWDYAGEMQLLRTFWDAATALDSAAESLDEGRRFPLCRPEPLAELFRDSGLHGVQVWPIDVTTHFRDFDDYWSPFLGGQGPAPGYVASLDAARREALRARLEQTLPTAADGSIELIARAWAARGGH